MSIGQEVTYRTIQGTEATGRYTETHKMTGELRIFTGTGHVYVQPSRVIV
jgi:hypothetical protein